MNPTFNVTSNLVDYKYENIFKSNDYAYTTINFDFIDNSIQIYSYSLQSEKGGDFLKNWVFKEVEIFWKIMMAFKKYMHFTSGKHLINYLNIIIVSEKDFKNIYNIIYLISINLKSSIIILFIENRIIFF